MTTETRPTQEDLRKLVDREVHYCVSSLVATLAKGADITSMRIGYGEKGPADLIELCEQAMELCTPIADYEEAAIQAGWRCVDDTPGLEGVAKFPWRHTDARSREFQASAQDACELDGLEPYEREIYEHWIVSDWLADKLEAKGERVDKDFAGLTVWGRTTTGQAIYMDSVIEDIWRDLHAPAEPEGMFPVTEALRTDDEAAP